LPSLLPEQFSSEDFAAAFPAAAAILLNFKQFAAYRKPKRHGIFRFSLDFKQLARRLHKRFPWSCLATPDRALLAATTIVRISLGAKGFA
jgi:hypothetical protein